MYSDLIAMLRSLADEEPYFIPLLANASALLFDALSDVNWVGFYLIRNGRLVLAPFQGKVACIHIPIGDGVCGTAAQNGKTVLVPDVHQFPGHIACDSASNSEIVVPLFQDNKVVGVLDIDSPQYNRFSENDCKGLEAFCRVLESVIIWEGK